jgi:hypothetical protein
MFRDRINCARYEFHDQSEIDFVFLRWGENGRSIHENRFHYTQIQSDCLFEWTNSVDVHVVVIVVVKSF